MRILKKLKKYIKKLKGGGIVKTLRATFYCRIDRLCMFLMKYICASKPLTDTIVIESHNDFDSNGGGLYNYLIKNHFNKKYKIIWVVKNAPPKDLPENVYCFGLLRPSIKKAYYLCTSKYWFYCDFTVKKLHEGQVIVYLTHGSFGLKNTRGKLALPKFVDFCLCPSEYVAPILAEQLKLPYPNNKQVVLGYPSNDVFYSKEPGDLIKLTSHKYKKVILWMPTFRKLNNHYRNDSKGDLPLGIPVFKTVDELKLLNENLKLYNSLLIIKIHPMQELESTKVESLSNIMVLNGITVKEYGVDNYRLMKDTDALISDYSSAAYDYLHAGKPIAYTMDDLDDYKLGLLVENPADWVGGPIIYNKEEFISFIYSVLNGEDEYKRKREELFDKIYKYHDGDSSKRLAEFIGL